MENRFLLTLFRPGSKYKTLQFVKNMHKARLKISGGGWTIILWGGGAGLDGGDKGVMGRVPTPPPWKTLFLQLYEMVKL